MKMHKNSTEAICTFLDHMIESSKQQDERIHALQVENERLCAERTAALNVVI
jgi:ribosomal 50S subunit-associated protein YjgA (DUF615 family)